MDEEDTQLSAIVNHYKCIINVNRDEPYLSQNCCTKTTNETRAFFEMLHETRGANMAAPD